MTPSETAQVQQYLRAKFDNNRLTLRPHKKGEDSVEVYLGEEFLGVIYRDDDDGEVSYDFNMAILEMDLPQL